MTKNQLNRLIKNHAKVNKLNRPSISSYARSVGLHPSTLVRWLNGSREHISPGTANFLDMEFLGTVFTK